MHRTAPWIVVAVVAAGCALDKHRYERPARLQIGANARSFAGPPARDVTFRETQPSPPSPEAGATGAGRFTMGTRYHAYFGGELETGAFVDRKRSNIAGAYAVGGLESASRYGALAVEVVGGWRALRYDGSAPTHHQAIVEPRLRGQLWLSSQLTFGAAIGTTLGHDAWMAGVYLGVHSNGFDLFKE
jgi:hypothetical protein